MRCLVFSILVVLGSASQALALAIQGRVLDNTNAPITNATLKITGTNIADQTIITKTDGAFYITLNANTEYKIVATATNYQTRIVLFNTRNITTEIISGEYAYNIPLNLTNTTVGVLVTYSRYKNFVEMVNYKTEAVAIEPPIKTEEPIITNPIIKTPTTTVNTNATNDSSKNVAVINPTTIDTAIIVTPIKSTVQTVASKLESIKAVTRINSDFATNATALKQYVISMDTKAESNYKNKLQRQLSRNKQIIDESGNPITSLYATIANYQKQVHAKQNK